MSILRQAAVYLPSRVIPGALNFLGLILYARTLGPAGFGHLTLLVGVSTTVNGTALYWVRSSYLRAAAEVTDDRAVRATALRLNAAIVAGIALVALLLTLPGWVGWLEAAAVVSLIAAQNACEVRQEFLRAHQRAVAYGVVALVRAAVALLVALLLLRFTALGYLAPLAGLICGGVASLLYAQRVDPQPGGAAFTPGLLQPFFVFGVPLIPYFALQAALFNVDRFLLNRLLGVSAAGAYAAGYDAVQQSIGLVFVAVSLAGVPLIFKAHAEGGLAWRVRAREYGGLLLAVVVLLALLLTLYAEPLSARLLGGGYAAVAVTLPLVAWSAVLGGLRANYVDVAFQVSRRTAWQLGGAALALLLNVALDLTLIPRLGIPGAAVASLVAQGAALLLSAGLSRRAGAMPVPLVACGQVLLAGAVMGALAWASRGAPALLSAPLSAAGFVAVVLLARLRPGALRRGVGGVR